MESIAEYLPQHPFFAGLDESVAGLVAGCAVNVHFRPDQHLFHEGEPADTFYVIRHGRVSLEVHAPAGPPVVVDSAHDDDVVLVSGDSHQEIHLGSVNRPPEVTAQTYASVRATPTSEIHANFMWWWLSLLTNVQNL